MKWTRETRVSIWYSWGICRAEQLGFQPIFSIYSSHPGAMEYVAEFCVKRTYMYYSEYKATSLVGLKSHVIYETIYMESYCKEHNRSTRPPSWLSRSSPWNPLRGLDYIEQGCGVTGYNCLGIYAHQQLNSGWSAKIGLEPSHDISLARSPLVG
jgi:hypothetical protein